MSASEQPPPEVATGDSTPQTPATKRNAICDLNARLADLAIDEGAIEVHQDKSGRCSSDPKKANRSFDISPPFVRRDAASEDDVFGTPTKHQAPQHSIEKKQAMETHWRGARSDSSSSLDSDSKSELTGQLIQGVAQSGQKVRTELAQSLYPPICCVFVANLLQLESDESLEASVTEAFRDFGKVWVKVRRDHKNMPFAFCQYTTVENAERAIIEGNGRMINGRPCRCEQAKAHRIFYIERKYGAVITPAEVMEVFGGFGDIVTCRAATPAERATLDANIGVIIEYSMYDHGQNAYNAYKNHALYKVSPLANMTKERSTYIRRSPTYTAAQAREIIDTYDVDRRSIFVGSLSSGITEDDVRQLFQGFGTIVDVILRGIPSRYNSDVMMFAFVEFEDAAATDKAIAAMHGFKLADRSGNTRSIRVYQRDSKSSIGRSVRSNSAFSPVPSLHKSTVPHTPRNLTPATPSPPSGYHNAYHCGPNSNSWSPYGNSNWNTQSCDMGWNQGSPYSYPGYLTSGYGVPNTPSPYHSGPPAASPYQHNAAPTNSPAAYSPHWYYYPGYGYVPYNTPPQNGQIDHISHIHPQQCPNAVSEEDRVQTPIPSAQISHADLARAA